MDAWLHAFRNIAPYLTHPLVLIGFVLMLFFGIHGQLIDSGIIPPLDQEAGGGVVQAILRYGFWIALAVVVLGFALQFFKHRKANVEVSASCGVAAGRNIHTRDIMIGESGKTSTKRRKSQ